MSRRVLAVVTALACAIGACAIFPDELPRTDDTASPPPPPETQSTPAPGDPGALDPNGPHAPKHDETVTAVPDDPSVQDAGNAPLPPDASTGTDSGATEGGTSGDAAPPPPPLPPSPPPVVVFMNRAATVITPGSNNSAKNTSQIVTASTTFPASTLMGQNDKWAAFLGAVRGHLARYNVAVIDVEPASGNYIETVVTSAPPSIINRPANVWGIAPTRCGLVAAAIAFVFDHGSTDARILGEVAAHEIGHTLSLSHTQTPSDLMSYSNVTPKKFEDIFAACGTAPGASETCNCPGTTQNNHQQLLKYVGAAP